MSAQMQSSNVIKSLVGAELALAEKTAGLAITTLEDPNYPKIGLLYALAWVYERRGNRDLKYDEYMETTSMERIGEVLGLDLDGDEGEAPTA